MRRGVTLTEPRATVQRSSLLTALPEVLDCHGRVPVQPNDYQLVPVDAAVRRRRTTTAPTVNSATGTNIERHFPDAATCLAPDDAAR